LTNPDNQAVIGNHLKNIPDYYKYTFDI